MKNGLIVWNILLTVTAAVLLFMQFGKKGSKAMTVNSSKDSLAVQSGFKIAYFEMDSVESNFDMVKDVKSEINKKDEEYNANLNNLDQSYRKRYEELSQSAKTQAEVEGAQNELKLLGDKLKAQKQDLDQQYQDFVMRRNLTVKKKIEDFLQNYNKNKDYSYIVAYEQGLFYYKDSAYNITKDLVQGLNEEYKKNK